jgi:hypothetical protein
MSACGSGRNIGLAAQAVEEFHSQLNSERYSLLYAHADAKFHSATTESDFTQLLQTVRQKLGTVQSSSRRSTGVAWFAGQGATVTLVYDTSFASGVGTEQFVWHVKDDRATLYGYHISSNNLIAK